MEQSLKSIPVFSLIEPSEAPELLKLLRPVALEPGQVLFREKTPGNAMWVLGKGAEVSISATPPGGKRPALIAMAKEGETVGEMALIDDGPRSATAVVMQAGPAHQIVAADFRVLRDAFHPLAYKILRQLCRELCARLRATSDRIAASSEAGGGQTSIAASTRHATAAELEEFAPLRALPKVVKLALSQKLRPVTTDAAQPIFAEGEEGDSAFFLVEGEVSVGRNGQTLATLKPGAMVGLIAVIDHGRRSASCETTGPARLLRLARQDFESLFNSGNRFAFQIVDLASRQLVAHLREANELLPGKPKRASSFLLPTAPAESLNGDAEVVSLDLEMELAR